MKCGAVRYSVPCLGIQGGFSCNTNSMSESSYESQAFALCKQQQMLQPLSCTDFILAITCFTHFCPSLVVTMINVFTFMAQRFKLLQSWPDMFDAASPPSKCG